MDDSEESGFWDRLEYRVCDELACMEDKRFRSLWCDGFIPEEYDLGEHPVIRGRVWIGIGPRSQEKWRFALLIGAPAHSRAEIDWSALLPAAGMTRWLTADIEARMMEIEPGAAVADDEAS